jgi:hypothetical protein
VRSASTSTSSPICSSRLCRSCIVTTSGSRCRRGGSFRACRGWPPGDICKRQRCNRALSCPNPRGCAGRIAARAPSPDNRNLQALGQPPYLGICGRFRSRGAQQHSPRLYAHHPLGLGHLHRDDRGGWGLARGLTNGPEASPQRSFSNLSRHYLQLFSCALGVGH